ncbi:helix-turn-helix domain-containing protein [Microbacterium sp. SA39]|uniref:helix-turn-helix domain-containing protein n=1 Tax=Microbacterium sp. SA39 TaxID=1263625 RepID=UPI00061F0990|nr:helix-turn-helix domain-containing protein [Microbacterium sp. SA39]KJQ54154.1 Helix-turn-helix domain of resolvase [Microbacterium sp. SA39]
MTIPAPITAEQRDRVAQLAREGMTRNAIAKEIGISTSTVSKYAHRAGISFNRSKTAAATAAVQIDNAARREALASKILTKLDTAVEAIDVTKASAGARDMAHIMRSLAAASRSFADATKASPLKDTGNDDIRVLVGAFLSNLNATFEGDNYGTVGNEDT